MKGFRTAGGCLVNLEVNAVRCASLGAVIENRAQSRVRVAGEKLTRDRLLSGARGALRPGSAAGSVRLDFQQVLEIPFDLFAPPPIPHHCKIARVEYMIIHAFHEMNPTGREIFLMRWKSTCAASPGPKEL